MQESHQTDRKYQHRHDVRPYRPGGTGEAERPLGRADQVIAVVSERREEVHQRVLTGRLDRHRELATLAEARVARDAGDRRRARALSRGPRELGKVVLQRLEVGERDRAVGLRKALLQLVDRQAAREMMQPQTVYDVVAVAVGSAQRPHRRTACPARRRQSSSGTRRIGCRAL